MVSIPALWIYIGEADDLRERLMKHFDGDSPCIARYAPTRFVFELIDDPTAREARYRELVRQHGPVCNAKQLKQELITSDYAGARIYPVRSLVHSRAPCVISSLPSKSTSSRP
jgi:hypothetical protein